MNVNEPLWSLVSEHKLLLSGWEGEGLYVAYSISTGGTHLLDEVSTEILHRVNQSACTTKILVDALNEVFSFGAEVDPASVVEASLGKLQSAGLIDGPRP